MTVNLKIKSRQNKTKGWNSRRAKCCQSTKDGIDRARDSGHLRVQNPLEIWPDPLIRKDEKALWATMRENKHACLLPNFYLSLCFNCKAHSSKASKEERIKFSNYWLQTKQLTYLMPYKLLLCFPFDNQMRPRWIKVSQIISKGHSTNPWLFSKFSWASLICVDEFLKLLGGGIYWPRLFKHKVKLKVAIYTSISVLWPEQ